MKTIKAKQSYIQRKFKQLRQWDRVIEKLNSRSENISGQSKTDLDQHIRNILLIKASTEYKLFLLQQTGSNNWEDLKVNLEQSWLQLRNAFLNTSETSGNNEKN